MNYDYSKSKNQKTMIIIVVSYYLSIRRVQCASMTIDNIKLTEVVSEM